MSHHLMPRQISSSTRAPGINPRLNEENKKQTKKAEQRTLGEPNMDQERRSIPESTMVFHEPARSSMSHYRKGPMVVIFLAR